MKLPKVDKEDLEDGKRYLYYWVLGEHASLVIPRDGTVYLRRHQLECLSDLAGEFYGPMELGE